VAAGGYTPTSHREERIRSDFVGFVVCKMVLDRVFSENLSYALSVLFEQCSILFNSSPMTVSLNEPKAENAIW